LESKPKRCINVSEYDDLEPLLFLMLQDDEEGLSDSERRRFVALHKTLEQRYGGAQGFAEARQRWERGEEPSDSEYIELRALEIKAGERS
jgi:hypothetical protein